MANKLIPMEPAQGVSQKVELRTHDDWERYRARKYDYDAYNDPSKIKDGLYAVCPNDNCGLEFAVDDPKGFIRVEEVEKLLERVYRLQSELEDLIMVMNDLVRE